MGTLLQKALGKVALLLYRVCALFLLYAVLASVLAYMSVMALYAFNTSWVAPVVLSPADDKSLSLTASLLTTQLTIESLTLDVKRQNDSVAEMRTHLATLMGLEPALEVAIARENKHNAGSGKKLARLEVQKRADNVRTRAGLNRLIELEAGTNGDLTAGLITKTEAAAQLTSINQAQAVYTDSEIGAVLLNDNVLQKSTIDTKALDVLDRKAALKSQIAQLEIAIGMAEAQSQADIGHIERLRSSTVPITQTPYYIVKAEGQKATFAFVPYDNKGGIGIGISVYDCYLKVILCREVGTIKQVFTSEEHGSHPIFRTDLRGFLVQLDLDNQESAKSKTLFVNRKPLLF
jgi:hypothetical protein